MPAAESVDLGKQSSEINFPEELLRSITRFCAVIAVCASLALPAVTQETPKVALDYSPALFAVLSAINACGYDAEVAESNPVRSQVRGEIAQAVQSPNAQEAVRRMCGFYNDHLQPDSARQLAQYVSLALHLGDAPSFTPTVPEADLPPDAVYVLGFVPLLQNFWVTADMNRIWNRHQKDYEALVAKYHKPVTDLLFGTDIYLKQPISGYVGRGFTIYLEPMAAPGQVNARNYGVDYYMVVSPDASALKLDQVRHTYLHYVLDPLTLKRTSTMRRLSPLLETVSKSPLDDGYKQDISLLVTESLVRAIEARQVGGSKGAETGKLAKAEESMREGFILTRYFYDALIEFEKSPVGLKDAYGDWLHYIDVSKELKRAQSIQFASSSTPEVVRPGKKETEVLDVAERQLAAGNRDAAEKLAQQALTDSKQDAGRASFILARVATLKGDMKGAEFYFQKALKSAQDPIVLAWSHIYLGRISDLREQREQALEHYNAALTAGDAGADAKNAAERGIQQPYEPPTRSEKN